MRTKEEIKYEACEWDPLKGDWHCLKSCQSVEEIGELERAVYDNAGLHRGQAMRIFKVTTITIENREQM